MAELTAPTVEQIVNDPAFDKAVKALEDINSQPTQGKPGEQDTPVASSATGGSKEAASGTSPPAEPERVPLAESAATGETDAQPESWIDADTIEFAKSYGFDEDRLRKFSSREDFDNVASFLDDQIRRSAKTVDPQTKVDPLGASDSVPPTTEPPPSSEAPKHTPPAKLPVKDVEQFDIEALRKEGYDDNSLKLFEQVNIERRQRAELEQKLGEIFPFVEQVKQQQAAAQRQQQQQVVYDFHSNTDKLNPNLFGRAIDDQGRFAQITAEQKANRDRLYTAADSVARHIQTAGMPLPPMPVLLKRAQALEFAQELVAEESQKLKDGIRAQSAMRRPTGANKPVATSKPLGPGSSINERMSHLSSDPEFNRLFNQLEAEAGAR